MVVGPRPMRTAFQTTHFGPASSAWHHTIESSLASDGKLRWTGSEAATHLHIGVAGPKALHTGRASPQALGTGSPGSPRIGIGGTGRTQDLRSDFLEAGLGAVGIGLITAARHITFYTLCANMLAYSGVAPVPIAPCPLGLRSFRTSRETH